MASLCYRRAEKDRDGKYGSLSCQRLQLYSEESFGGG
jgi:hypothetical protein